MHNLTTKSKALRDCVIIQNVTGDKEYVYGEIFLLDNKIENEKLVEGKIISVGNEVKFLKPDDLVLYDKHSVFSDRKVGTERKDELVITKAVNVICKLKEKAI